MIITIKGANFKDSNIGTLSSYTVRFSGNGVSGSPTSIAKNEEGTQASANYVGTITVSSSYTYKSVSSVTVNGTALSTSDYTVSGMNITIPANKITGNVVITVATEKVNTEPDTPTMYTFTINPTPSSATVTLTASGYSQSGNSITVPANTSVAWKVSASGYTERTGTHTVTKTESKSVTLSATGGAGEETGVILATWDDYNIVGFVRPAGTISTSNTYYRTDYIDISQYNFNKIKAYTHPASSSVSPIVFFDTNKTFISGFTPEAREDGGSNGYGYEDWFEMEVPENAAYVMSSCLSSKPTDKTLVQVIGYTN